MRRHGSIIYLQKLLLHSCCLLLLTYGLNAQCDNNVVPNAGFEQGLNGWIILGEAELSSDAIEGSQSVEIGGDGSRILQTLPAQAGNEYSFSLAWKKLGPLGNASCGFKFLDSNYSPLSFHLENLNSSGDFTYVSNIEAFAPSGTSFIEITAYTNAQAPALRVDDFCLSIINSTNHGPDLALADLQGDFQAEQGASYIFTFDVFNQGNQIIPNSVTFNAYLSDDNVFDGVDVLVGQVSIPSVLLGVTEDVDITIQIPSNALVGTNHLFLLADPDNQVDEFDENNNLVFVPFIVQPGIGNPPGCDLSLMIGQAGEFVCNNNGTPSDPSDDTWGLPFIAYNANNANGEGYSVSGGGLNFTGKWGEQQFLSGFQISNGLLDLNLSDLENSNCAISIENIPPPLTCSNGSFSGCSDNLLPNSGFEDGLAHWTVLDAADLDSEAYEGVNSLLVYGNGNRVQQTLPAIAGDRFSLVAQAKKLGNNGSASIELKYLTSDFIPLNSTNAPIPVDEHFQSVATILLEAPANTAHVEVSVYTDPGSPDVLVDDFCLKKFVGQGGANLDLVFDAIDVPPIGEPGSPIAVDYTLTNYGTDDLPANILLGAYLSDDEFLSNDDLFMSAVLTAGAPAGTPQNRTTNIQIPLGVAAGDYFFIFNADHNMSIEEMNEDNNFIATTITIAAGFDLISVDCNAVAPLPKEEFISAVKINHEELQSGKSEYSNFRNVIFDIPMEEENFVSLTVGFNAIHHSEYIRIYVDFNHDGWYDASEIYVDGVLEAGNLPGQYEVWDSGLFYPEATNYMIGKTNMRVLMSREGFPLPCGEIKNGDVEDYSVNIVSKINTYPFDFRDELLGDSELKVYPNPASDYININLEEAYNQNGIIYITNAIGEVVWQSQIEDIGVEVFGLDIAPFGPGLYGIWLKPNEGAAKFAKVVLKRR